MCVRYRGDEVGEGQEKLLSLGRKVHYTTTSSVQKILEYFKDKDNLIP